MPLCLVGNGSLIQLRVCQWSVILTMTYDLVLAAVLKDDSTWALHKQIHVYNVDDMWRILLSTDQA